MRYFVFVLACIVTQICFTQDKKEVSQSVTKKFVTHYNNEEYDAMHEMLSKEMKEKSSLDKIKDTFSSLKNSLGKINTVEFVKWDSDEFGLYKTVFEYSVMGIHLAIDENKQITGIKIMPLAKEENNESIINNLRNSNALITPKQQDIIFDKAKVFPNNTELAIALVKDGEVTFYGVSKQNDTISPILNQKNTFEIGSVSKVFTATILANMVVNKDIKLEDNVFDYLSTKNKRKLNFISLANHTSGLPRLPTNLDLSKVDQSNPYVNYKESNLLEYLEHYSNNKSQQANYVYSNLGAGLLGYSLSQIKKVSYGDLLENYIFSKYNMMNSTVNRNNITSHLVEGLNAKGEKVPNWDLGVLQGAGAIISNTEDLSKFLTAQFDESNTELALTRQKTHKANNNMSIALGWHIIESESHDDWVWHNGGTGGYTSSIALNTKTKNGIIILSNVSAFNPNMGNIDKLCFSLMSNLDNSN